MHLINLSLDQSLFNSKKIGDSHQRFVAYAKGFDSFTVIVPTQIKTKSYTKNGISYILARGSNQLEAYFNVLKLLYKFVSQQKNSIIICNDPVLGFIALLVKIRFHKVKIQINSFGTRLNQWRWLLKQPINPLFWIVSLISLRFADSIRTDTTEDKKIIQRFTFRKDSDFLVLPVPPSVEAQQRLLIYKQKQKFSSPIKLLAIGSLTSNKDFQTLIHALSKIDNKKNFHLTLIGSGSEEKTIMKLVSQYQLADKVSINNSIDYTKLLNHYQSSDIFISSSRIEGLPRVLQEAALAGLPIVTTDHNGAKDFVIHEKTGLKVPIGDSHELAQAIEEFINKPQKALKLAQNCKAFARDYCNFERVVEELHKSWFKLGYEK